MLWAIFFLCLLITYLIFAGLTIWSGFIGAPFLWTPKKAILAAFEKAEIKPGQKFYDLGAGSGKALIVAEKKFGAQAVGFELSPFLYFFGRLNMFFNRLKNSKIYCRNFYNQDLSDADIIFCFLSIKAMEKLKPKFERELKSGAKVISYVFKIHGWESKEVIDGFSNKVYLYEISAQGLDKV